MLAVSSNTIGACQLWWPQVELASPNSIIGSRLSAGSHKPRPLFTPMPAYFQQPRQLPRQRSRECRPPSHWACASSSSPRRLPLLQAVSTIGSLQAPGNQSFVLPTLSTPAAPGSSCRPRRFTGHQAFRRLLLIQFLSSLWCPQAPATPGGSHGTRPLGHPAAH